MTLKKVIPASLVLLLVGCNKPDNFLYNHPIPRSYEVKQKVREVTGNSAIDIFWAIGGMTEQANNFQSGVGQFMQNFTQKSFTWRQAVVSSNTTQNPFVGMPFVFDNTDPNPVNNFVNGVVNALNGEDDEQIFDPVMINLQRYPNFLRPNATLALILTNDAKDYSVINTNHSQLLSYLLSLKNGDSKKIVVYGVFGSTDLNCAPQQIDEDWTYRGTEFDAAIQATGGQTYSLCDTTFGASLSKIGDNLYQRLDHPKIILDKRPLVDSIRVIFEGKQLPGGDKAAGGMWYFDQDTDAVVFYDLGFAKNDTDEVTVRFTEDLGVD